jgi:hypothetical protein
MNYFDFVVEKWCVFCDVGFEFLYIMYLGRDSVVGIVTRYRMDGPGIESRWWTRLSAPAQTGPGAHPASYKMHTGTLQKVKRPVTLTTHPHLAPRLKKE